MRRLLLFVMPLLCASAIAAGAPSPQPSASAPSNTAVPPNANADQERVINFNNIGIIEYIKFISRISGRNFIFEEGDLNFTVTIVSEQPTSLDNIMVALMQILRIHGLSLIEQGNNFLIHRNLAVAPLARLVKNDEEESQAERQNTEIITRLFHPLNQRVGTIQPVLTPLISPQAYLEIIPDTNHIIITDYASNVNKIAALLESLDDAKSGLEIGQYIAKTMSVTELKDLAEKVLRPLAEGNILVMVPRPQTNTLYIVSSSQLVNKALNVLSLFDGGDTVSGVLNTTAPQNLNKQNRQANQPGQPGYQPGVPQQVFPSILDLNKLKAAGVDLDTLRRADLDTDKLAQQIGRAISPKETSLDVLRGHNVTVDMLQKAGLNLDKLRNLGVDLLTGQFNTVAISRNENTLLDINKLTAAGVDFSLLKKAGLDTEKLGWIIGKIIPPQENSLSILQGATITEKILRQAGLNLGELKALGIDLSTGEFDKAPTVVTAQPELNGLLKNLLEQQRTEKEVPPGLSELLLGRTASPSQGPLEAQAATELTQRKAPSQFYVYKLQHKRGDQLLPAFHGLATSMAKMPDADLELIALIQSLQWLEGPNTFVFHGTPPAIRGFLSLVRELDVPSRQVLIEMLILQTTINNSLTFGVEIGVREQGPTSSLALTSIAPGIFSSPLPAALNALTLVAPPAANAMPVANGFNFGSIGKHITHNGTTFTSLGALIHALNDDADTNVVLAPRIITEDNVAAQIFVGNTTAFRAQSIASDQGTTITTNFDYQDIGTTLKVTPILGPGDVITLEVDQETSSAGTGQASESTIVTPVATKATATTRLHVPNNYFVILGGMTQDQTVKLCQRVPCLGSIPILGAAFRVDNNQINKTNMMIFIRPSVVTTADQIEEMTLRQRANWERDNDRKNPLDFEIEMGLEYLELKDDKCVELPCLRLPHFKHPCCEPPRCPLVEEYGTDEIKTIVMPPGFEDD